MQDRNMAEFIDDLTTLIEVADSSTVSRTVLTNEGVRIVLFSFDTGEELSEHTAAMPVLIWVLDGALSITASGVTHELRPGGVLSMTTREAHSVVALEPTRMALAMLDPRAKAAEK